MTNTIDQWPPIYIVIDNCLKISVMILIIDPILNPIDPI